MFWEVAVAQFAALKNREQAAAARILDRVIIIQEFALLGGRNQVC
jgi:hypothetical protein